MDRDDPYGLRTVLRRLGERGVQLWHNRGRLYCGPLDRVDAADRALLSVARDDLVALLRRCGDEYFHGGNPVAPAPIGQGSYAGRMVRKPWDYETCVILPHFGSVELLDVALRCWRDQTVSPYLIVIDTGGEDRDERGLMEFRNYDCEIHSIAAHGWRHSSQPVAAALDLGFAVAQTPAAVLTHTDVFPRHDRVIEELLTRLSCSCPVAGYQMSARIGSAEWAACVSHTLTVCDLRVMRAQRITWNLLAALEDDDEVEQRYLGWPDTETWFGRGLRAAGIVPEFLGSESNAPVYQTDLIVHWRSAPSIRYYAPAEARRRHPGLGVWLQHTRQLGHAAELPAEVAGLSGEWGGIPAGWTPPRD